VGPIQSRSANRKLKKSKKERLLCRSFLVSGYLRIVDEVGHAGDVLEVTYGLPRSDAIALPGEPGSATQARHFIRAALSGVGIQIEVIDCVELVASELVTNAVLHAATGPTVTLHVHPECIRVEVRDASTATPTSPNFGQDAATGRGLSVVSRASRSWGFDTDQFGKTVWAEFDMRPRQPAPTDQAPRTTSEIIIDSRFRGAVKLVRFNAVPVDLYIELEQANDATLREFELLTMQDNGGLEQVKHIHRRLAMLALQANSFFNPTKNRMRSMIQRAQRRHLKVVDLRTYIDEDSYSFAREFALLMSEADALSERGILLTSKASEAVCQLRKWFLDELQQQYLDNRAPIPFALRT
jgi:hypothetical protein